MALINEMINRAKHNIQQGSGTFMIYWGCMVAATGLLNIALAYALLWTSNPPSLSFLVWWIMVPAWIVSFMLKHTKRKSTVVRTHFDSVITSVWSGFGVSMAIFIASIFVLAHVMQENSHFYLLINPVILLLTGLGEFITAKICKFRPFLHGAIAMWAGSLLCVLAVSVFREAGVMLQLLILAACMVNGFVITGYKLNKLSKQCRV